MRVFFFFLKFLKIISGFLVLINFMDFLASNDGANLIKSSCINKKNLQILSRQFFFKNISRINWVFLKSNISFEIHEDIEKREILEKINIYLNTIDSLTASYNQYDNMILLIKSKSNLIFSPIIFQDNWVSNDGTNWIKSFKV